MQEWFKIAVIALKVSVLVQVFGIGFDATWRDATYLFRQPRLLWNSILARNVVPPIIAVLLIKTFSFHVAIAITLAVLAVTPVPPALPKSQLKAGARAEYVLGLVVSQSVLAVVLVPVTILFMDWALGAQAHFSSRQVAVLMFQTILLPLAVGMIAGRYLPTLKKIVPFLLTAGLVLLIGGAIPLLLLAWKTFGILAGNGAILSLVVFVIACMAAGHLLGGPVPDDRSTLAIASASRHPGLALAIASANFPNQIKLIAGAVVAYLLLRMILTFPYMRWTRSLRTSGAVAHNTT